MQFLALDIYQGKYQDFLEIIKAPEKPTLIFTPNPEILVWAFYDEDFRMTLSKADYLVPDGNGLYTGSMIMEGKSPQTALLSTFFLRNAQIQKYGELIKWSDLTRDIIEWLEQSGKQKSMQTPKRKESTLPHILIIDNYRIREPQNALEIKKKDIQSRFVDIFREQFPHVQVTVLFDGEMSLDAIAHMVEIQDISYIFSCIGMKEQEKILVELFAYIPERQKVVWLAVGSSIDYLVGVQKRAPTYIRSLWLEWLYRLIWEPRKRWKRVFTAWVQFPRLIEKNLPKFRWDSSNIW